MASFRPLYRPPEGTQSGVRLTGAHRAVSVDVPAIYVLAPDHVGLTLQQQAALYWYQSKPSNLQSELLMGTDDQPAPVLSLNKPQAAEAGMVKIDLLKHDVYLEKGGSGAGGGAEEPLS